MALVFDLNFYLLPTQLKSQSLREYEELHKTMYQKAVYFDTKQLNSTILTRSKLDRRI